MWKWTIVYSKSVQKQLQALILERRQEVENALQNHYWPQRSIKKSMGKIGTSLWPVMTEHYRILCSLNEGAQTVTVAEITPSRRGCFPWPTSE